MTSALAAATQQVTGSLPAAATHVTGALAAAALSILLLPTFSLTCATGVSGMFYIFYE